MSAATLPVPHRQALKFQQQTFKLNSLGLPWPAYAVMANVPWKEGRFGVMDWAEDMDEAEERLREAREDGHAEAEIWQRVQ